MRANKAPKVPTLPNQRVLAIPGRTSLSEEDQEVYCDETFFEASRLAVGPVKDLREYVKGACLVFCCFVCTERRPLARTN